MPFTKGHRGPGRPKGSKNKVNHELIEFILAALRKAGGGKKGAEVKYLSEMAQKSPAVFGALLGRILPKDVKLEHSGVIAFTERLRELEQAERESGQ